MSYIETTGKIRQNKKLLQTCPLCGVQNMILIKGTVKDLEDESKTRIIHNKGYSFCNCENIFYTDWSNIEQGLYDEDYFDKYNNDLVKNCYKAYAKQYFSLFKGWNPKGNKFLEIGSINDFLLDEAKDYGFEPTGLDINKFVDSKHDRITCDLEKNGIIGKYDFVFASHIFEHFKEPMKMLVECYLKLNPNGLLFISMPDPFFIDINDPYMWGHWWVNEHHILFDMYSFIKICEKVGFKCVHSQRNDSNGYICTRDYHIVLQKVGE